MITDNPAERLNKHYGVDTENKFCTLYNRQCIGVLCSITPDVEGCKYRIGGTDVNDINVIKMEDKC